MQPSQNGFITLVPVLILLVLISAVIGYVLYTKNMNSYDKIRGTKNDPHRKSIVDTKTKESSATGAGILKNEGDSINKESGMIMTLVKIEKPIINVPGNRPIYTIDVSFKGQSKEIRFDPFDSGKSIVLDGYPEFVLTNTPVGIHVSEIDD